MVVEIPQCAPARLEPAPTGLALTAVYRLLSRVDRLRALGRKDEADTALLQAWATYDI